MSYVLKKLKCWPSEGILYGYVRDTDTLKIYLYNDQGIFFIPFIILL